MKFVFAEKGVPRGCGQVERFFRSVDQVFLENVPGYALKGFASAEVTAMLVPAAMGWLIPALGINRLMALPTLCCAVAMLPLLLAHRGRLCGAHRPS